MRIILINVQILMLVIFIIATSMVGSGVSNMVDTAGASVLAAGPSALVVGGTLALAGVLGIALNCVPLLLLSATCFLCGITAGYRYLRWTRYLA